MNFIIFHQLSQTKAWVEDTFKIWSHSGCVRGNQYNLLDENRKSCHFSFQMNDQLGIPSCKVILLGNTCVGKTSIVLQFYKALFQEQGQPTIGAAYFSKIIDTPKGKLNMNVWDSAGQERFRSIIPMYLRGASGVIFVCSPDNVESIKDLNVWKNLLDKNQENKIFGYVVMNKCDLNISDSKTLAEAFAKENHYQFFETSAKLNINITELFNKIAADISNEIIFESVRSDESQIRVKNDNSSGCC